MTCAVRGVEREREREREREDRRIPPPLSHSGRRASAARARRGAAPLLASPSPPSLLSLPPRQYEGGEPCGVCGHTLAAPSPPCTATPSVPTAGAPPGRVGPGLWFGSYANAANPSVLRSLGVARILSLVPGGGELYPHSFTYTVLQPGNPDLGEAVAAIGKREEEEDESEEGRQRGTRARPAPPHNTFPQKIQTKPSRPARPPSSCA